MFQYSYISLSFSPIISSNALLLSYVLIKFLLKKEIRRIRSFISLSIAEPRGFLGLLLPL